ncbi:hypothetical protein O181_099799 [Austropuccinia psidii MF-1]|uniref:Uncharacterized protein n=1 Tax=Austropuccinia psidii MF-1 TaxID=1389203 RepID=A0A9Q3JDD8_9BASI|nr:hypothetical protein [Austropuccinia psidii MF-1]
MENNNQEDNNKLIDEGTLRFFEGLKQAEIFYQEEMIYSNSIKNAKEFDKRAELAFKQIGQGAGELNVDGIASSLMEFGNETQEKLAKEKEKDKNQLENPISKDDDGVDDDLEIWASISSRVWRVWDANDAGTYPMLRVLNLSPNFSFQMASTTQKSSLIFQNINIIISNLCEEENNKNTMAQKHGGSKPGRIGFLFRDHHGGYQRLFKDYFSEDPVYNNQIFCRRFRMQCSLFLKITADIEEKYAYFQQRANKCLWTKGLNSTSKDFSSNEVIGIWYGR